MNRHYFIAALAFMLLILVVSCRKILPGAPSDDEVLDGPVESLTYEQNQQHLRGDVAFNDQVFTPETGLGPVFVATSCGSCHIADGKGHPFTTLTRFGQSDSTGNKFLDQGGPLLQVRAVPGYHPEKLPAGAPVSRLTPPIVTGGGFIELVPEADILAMADPDDLDGDGISGVPNWSYLPSYITPGPGSVTQGGKYLCRFGKKGATFNLLQQTVTAYNQDIGITSVYNPLDAWSLKDIDPEISSSTVHDVVFYLQTLKAPVQRDQDDPDVIAGKTIFNKIGCNSCHKSTLKTGYSPLEGLSNKEFHPYTDLLLHDMGPPLDDGYTEGSAKTSEWRTAPLWGLGLAPKSQGGQYFLLHDGRAHSIEEAISFHAGEASSRRDKYNALSAHEKQQLITFLKSL